MDKLQHNWMKTVKKIGLVIILIFILISSTMSIYQQSSILIDARKRNAMMKKELDELQRENNQLKKQMEYATSSASIARKTPGNDFRLILPPEDQFGKLKEEAVEEVSRPTIIEWWELFTK